MSKIKIDEQGLYDLLRGSTFLASGGGGAKINGADLIKLILKDEKWKGQVKCVSVNELDDESNLGVVGAPASPKAIQKYGFGKSPLRSFNLMEKLYNDKNPFTFKEEKKFKYNYTIPIETGCIGQLMAVQIAMKKDIEVLDGDGAGRAYPKMSMNTFCMSGVPIAPLSLVTEESVDNGGADMIVNLKNPDMVDEIFRNIIGTAEFHDESSSTCFTMKGKKAKEKGTIVLNTVSRAMALGKLMRESDNPKEDTLDFLKTEFGFAKVIIDGKIESIEQKIQGGFDIGIIKVKNQNEEIDILNQNENIIAWSSKKSNPVAMGPDLICYMDKKGEVYSTPDLVKGQDVIVVGIKADSEYNKEYIQNKFLEILKKLNYYGPYVPIEELK
ncbi:MAG: DUF917 domain-containing protein [Fusobacteriota bacterium]